MTPDHPHDVLTALAEGPFHTSCTQRSLHGNGSFTVLFLVRQTSMGGNNATEACNYTLGLSCSNSQTIARVAECSASTYKHGGICDRTTDAALHMKTRETQMLL